MKLWITRRCSASSTPASQAFAVAGSCGDSGCLEAVAAGWALVQAARTGGHEITHVRDLVALAVKVAMAITGMVAMAEQALKLVLLAQLHTMQEVVVAEAQDLEAAVMAVLAVAEMAEEDPL